MIEENRQANKPVPFGRVGPRPVKKRLFNAVTGSRFQDRSGGDSSTTYSSGKDDSANVNEFEDDHNVPHRPDNDPQPQDFNMDYILCEISEEGSEASSNRGSGVMANMVWVSNSSMWDSWTSSAYDSWVSGIFHRVSFGDNADQAWEAYYVARDSKHSNRLSNGSDMWPSWENRQHSFGEFFKEEEKRQSYPYQDGLSPDDPNVPIES